MIDMRRAKQTRLARIAGNALLAAFTLTVCAAGLELILRLTPPIQRPIHHIASSKIAFEPDTSARYSTSEYDFLIQINRVGRRDSDWSPGTLADPANILVIGDSFVLGYGVDQNDSIPELLEQKLRKSKASGEVFNFGMPGDISLPEYKRLLNESLRLGIKADRVIVGIFIGNDFGFAPVQNAGTIGPNAGKKFPLNPSSLKTVQFVKNRIASSPLLSSWVLSIGDLFGKKLYLSSASDIYLKDPSLFPADRFYKILDNLVRIREICDREGKSLWVVVFPNKLQVETKITTTRFYDFLLPNIRIREYCRTHRIRCYDLTDDLRNEYANHKQPLYFPLDRHLNPRGNALAADFIWKLLDSASPNPDAPL